jgi:hypothetical protein
MYIRRGETVVKLFEISQEYHAIIDDLYDDEGNENPQALARLEVNQVKLEEKAIAIASWLKNLEIERASINAAKREIDEAKKNMIERERAIENKISRWNGYLQSEMETRGIKEIKCPYFVLKLKKNPPSLCVNDADDESIAEEYRVYSWKLDRARMLNELKNGVIIDGARLEQRMRLEIK